MCSLEQKRQWSDIIGLVYDGAENIKDTNKLLICIGNKYGIYDIKSKVEEITPEYTNYKINKHFIEFSGKNVLIYIPKSSTSIQVRSKVLEVTPLGRLLVVKLMDHKILVISTLDYEIKLYTGYMYFNHGCKNNIQDELGVSSITLWSGEIKVLKHSGYVMTLKEYLLENYDEAYHTSKHKGIAHSNNDEYFRFEAEWTVYYSIPDYEYYRLKRYSSSRII